MGAPDFGIVGTPCHVVVGGLLLEVLCIAVVRRLVERAPLQARLASCFLPMFLLVLLLLLLGLRPKRLRAVTATVLALLAVEALNAAVATSRVHDHSPPRDALGRRARQIVDEHVPHCRLDFLEPEVALAKTGLPNVSTIGWRVVRLLNLYRDKKTVRCEPGRDGKILSDHRQDGNDEVNRL